jgi:predicted DNA-binding transcriptional regulator AlpA
MFLFTVRSLSWAGESKQRGDDRQMLPGKLYRFIDLKRVGVNNYPTLKRWQETQGFPKGRLLGENTRVWTEEEIVAWWDSKADPPPEIVKPAPSVGPEGSGRVTKAVKHPLDSESAAPAQASMNGGAHE